MSLVKKLNNEIFFNGFLKYNIVVESTNIYHLYKIISRKEPNLCTCYFYYDIAKNYKTNIKNFIDEVTELHQILYLLEKLHEKKQNIITDLKAELLESEE